MEAHTRTGVWGLTWAGDTAVVHSSNCHKFARTAALLPSVRSLFGLQKALLSTVSGPKCLSPVLSSFQAFFFSEAEKGGIGNRKKEIRLLLYKNFF